MVLLMTSFLLTFLSAILGPNFGVTFAAVNRAILSRLKRHLCFFATRGTDGGIHFPRSVIVAVPATTLLSLGLSA